MDELSKHSPILITKRSEVSFVNKFVKYLPTKIWYGQEATVSDVRIRKIQNGYVLRWEEIDGKTQWGDVIADHEFYSKELLEVFERLEKLLK
jgi:hypothetical protein